ncbi:bifunctional diguanylate cyclase/phosphodiesterase [Pseudomonas maioricensis]|uniref:bifunctional diguanylate cyclase/phosphodiesterase n=1 Tax=Pseudomonas maioricensis TaxID=1766623 RepID=UPI001FAD6102
MNEAQATASRYKGSYSTFLLPLGVLFIGAVLSYGLGALDNARSRDSERDGVTLQLSSLGTRLAERVRFAFSGTEGIAQLISIDGSISPQHFRRMAQSAIEAVPYIRHIVIAPGDVIQDTYPLAGNEGIIGLNYSTRPEQFPLIVKARLSGAALLAGPVTLYQGGRELIYRRPVFLSARHEHDAYWGLVSVVAGTDALLKAGGIEEEEGLKVALRGQDGHGAEGGMIYGDAALFQSDPVLVEVSIPGGTWQLAAQPKAGWAKVTIIDSSLFLLAISTSLLLSIFILQASLNHRLIRRRNSELRDEIAERENISSSLVQSEDRFRTLFERSPDPIWIRGQDGRINLGNSAGLRALGFEGPAFPSVTVADISPQFQPDGQSSADKAAALRAEVEREGSLRFEWDHKRVDGSVFPTEVTLCTMQLAHEQVTYAIVRDITARKEAERGLERLAHFDSVTGLPNRVLFHKQLNQGIEQAKRQNNCMAVLMLDLDGFKMVNDSLGHPMGDLLLQHATRRFVDAVRFGDVVARLGGDEFGFILDGLECEADAVPVVGMILRSLQEPFDLEGTAALVTASIGVTMYPANGATAQALLTQADTAMYAAKEGGRNDFCFYQPHMTTLIQARVALEAALRQALERNEFEVWYQSKLDLKSGRVEGAEALIRWRSPTLGLVSPADFIPLAERTGLIVSIGQWVLEHVCRQARRWRDSGVFTRHVAINVAVLQIERGNFVEDVRLALQRHDLPPQALEIEVTESLIMNRQELAHTVLSQLRSMGLTVAVDDFGTGYSSLAYLKDLPIDNLKIDRTFVSGLPHDKAYVAITQAVIELGHALGFTVTAEGIETPEQLAFLRNAGCDTGQGYLISRPMPVDEFEEWLGVPIPT